MTKIGEKVSTTISKIREDGAEGFTKLGNGIAKGVAALKNTNSKELAKTALTFGSYATLFTGLAYVSSPENSAVLADTIAQTYFNVAHFTSGVTDHVASTLGAITPDFIQQGNQQLHSATKDLLAAATPDVVKDFGTDTVNVAKAVIDPKNVAEFCTTNVRGFSSAFASLSAGLTTISSLELAERKTNGGVTRTAKKGKELAAATVNAVRELKQNGR